jgi:hypothetical protein
MTVATYALEVMWDPAATTSAFDDQFTSLANWTLEAGSTFTVASNLVSNAAGSGNRMSAGDASWTDILTGTRIRFKWVTGGAFAWFLRYVDSSNFVFFHLSGTNFSLVKEIGGVQTGLSTPAVTPVNGNFYWIQPVVSGTQWSATLNNDSAGAPGSIAATITAQTITDSVVQAGKMAVQMDGGTGMQMGGNFADVLLVKTPTWTDESANLKTASWRRGRDYASQLTGRSTAGVLEARLNNVGGRYAPLNTASPLYGFLLPGRKVRIRSTSPVAATLWQGFLEEIRPSPNSRGQLPSVTLRASGPLRYIADKKASTAIYTSLLTGVAVGYILDDAAWPVGERLIDAGQITMTRWKADGKSALSHLQEIEEMEFGYIGESKDGKIIWEDGHHRITQSTTSAATFSDTLAAALPYENIEELDPWRDVYNIFSADVTLFTVQSLAVLWSLVGEQPSINAGETKDFWAIYPTPSSASQGDHVDAWTTPVVTTDFLANTQADGLGTNKSSAIVVSTSKFANAMKISLQNTDAGVVFITFLRARGTGVWRNDPIRVVSEDAASQLKFGKRTFPLPGKFYPSTAVAKTYVDAGLQRFKDQTAILSLRFNANQSAAHMTQALTRTVGERITVVANGTSAAGAQLGISADFFIETEKHETDLSQHSVTYALSDARTQAGYWILGTSQLGIDTKLFV